MSLSDYISIFDTRPIAQSHLFGAATATLSQHSRVDTRMNAVPKGREATNSRGVYRGASHGHATPRHAATPRGSTLSPMLTLTAMPIPIPLLAPRLYRALASYRAALPPCFYPSRQQWGCDRKREQAGRNARA